MNKIPDPDLQAIRALLEQATGLDFPPPRWGDLQRGIFAAAKNLGFHTWAEFTARLIRGQGTELESLVNHLTIGETYFFREKQSFEVLAERILPAILRARRTGERRLRIWSAACCTGEEPYSIAILLRRIIPDLENWDITLLATDINSHFLEKAVAGCYGKWSFRDAPAWLRPGYFQPIDDGHFQINPEIKKMVKFTRLNLADENDPAWEKNLRMVDVIFCRNVLMYFTPSQALKVIERLHKAQAEDGWLIVGPSELANVPGIPYAASRVHSAMVYQKQGGQSRIESPPQETPTFPAVAEIDIRTLIQPPVQVVPQDSRPIPKREESAMSLANQGKLSEALDRCDQWIADDKFNASSHYLRAVVLQEQGETDEAVRSLRTALYLDPNSIPAHFALGSIARNRGEVAQAARHLNNARKLLRGLQTEEILPEFEGVTAGRFLQMIESLIEREVAA